MKKQIIFKKTNLKKSKSLKVYKNKKINNGNFGNFTLNDYQVFLLLISKLGFVDVDGKYKQPEKLEREHILTAKEFSTIFNLSLPKVYGVLKDACKKLMQTSIIAERPELKEIWEINVCSTAKYCEHEGRINIQFTDTILPYLSQQVSKRFTVYKLKDISNFGSLYTTRLFELINEFKSTGWMQKTIDELRTTFAIQPEELKLYGDFKRYVIKHAVDEINKCHPHMQLSFTEVKESRKVVAIIFEFAKNERICLNSGNSDNVGSVQSVGS